MVKYCDNNIDGATGPTGFTGGIGPQGPAGAVGNTGPTGPAVVTATRPYIKIKNISTTVLPHNLTTNFTANTCSVLTIQGAITSNSGNPTVPISITILEAGTYMLLLKYSLEIVDTANQKFNHAAYIRLGGNIISSAGMSNYSGGPAVSATELVNATTQVLAVNDILTFNFFVFTTSSGSVNALSNANSFTTFSVLKIF